MPKTTVAEINRIIDSMPFNGLLGMRAARVHNDGITIECPLKPELLNFAGVLHGGVTATIADAAVGIALWNHFKGSRKHTTVEMKLNYLAPVVPGKGAKIVARARLVRIGQHLCIGQVDMHDGQRHRVGIAIVTYMLL